MHFSERLGVCCKLCNNNNNNNAYSINEVDCIYGIEGLHGSGGSFVYNSAMPVGRPPLLVARKKARTTFTRTQLTQLEDNFRRQKYLAATERSAVAAKLKMTNAQVKTWFQNRRTKWRYVKHLTFPS